MVYNLFNGLLNLVCECFMEEFYICANQRYWPVVFFPSGVFVRLWCQVMLSPSSGLESVSSSVFLEGFKKNW